MQKKEQKDVLQFSLYLTAVYIHMHYHRILYAAIKPRYYITRDTYVGSNPD